MTITCIKNGCHVYLAEYGAWVYGDAYSDGPGGALVIRVAGPIGYDGPLRDRQHFTIRRVGQWFDRHRQGESGFYSTLIATGSDWEQTGDYDGVPIGVPPEVGA